MYTEILCTKKCFYQTNGKCMRNTFVKDAWELSTDKDCIFYKIKTDTSYNTNDKFWAGISYNCY